MLSVRGSEFVLDGRPIRLRSVGLGGWLNLEHFMLGLPGTDREIREAITSVYGAAAAARFWETYTQVYTAEEDLRYVRDLGLNSVRVPVHYQLFGGSEDELASSEAIRELDRLVATAERLGLLVILDLHSAPGGQNPDWHCDNATGEPAFWRNEAHQTQVVELWTRVARHFRDSPVIGGYDVINEPCYFDDELDTVLVAFYERCIRAIREVDPEHVVFLEGNTYARDFSMFERNLDDQTAYSFHYYPFLQLPGELGSGDVAGRLRASIERDTTLVHLLRGLKRPVWCGETGHRRDLVGTVSMVGSFLGLLEQLGVSWALWPLKDARGMGLLSPRGQSAWMTLTHEVTGGWSFWDGLPTDSVQASVAEADRTLFYRRLAAATSTANRELRERLAGVPFETFLRAVHDFAFAACEPFPELLDAVRAGWRGLG